MKQYFPKFVFKYQLSLNTINAKADNNEYRDYFVNTIIYLPITVILDSDHYQASSPGLKNMCNSYRKKT
jgi:hypothetical protein